MTLIIPASCGSEQRTGAVICIALFRAAVKKQFDTKSRGEDTSGLHRPGNMQAMCTAHFFQSMKGIDMNGFRKSVMMSLAVISMSAVLAQAQPAPAPGAPAQGGQQYGERMKERMAQRQAELHDKLKLAPGQEPAWNAFISAMTSVQRPARPNRAEWEQLSAPDRMERRLEMMKQEEAAMSQRLQATKTFYATLTPDQQKIFNDSFNFRGHHHRH
jgi:Spy/CpxP family protein refolding chaperone